ncbi:MAG: helix-turn-helix domain-containing protein [Bacillota bacterium]
MLSKRHSTSPGLTPQCWSPGNPGWARKKAAQVLGVDHSTLSRKLKRYEMGKL